MRNLKTIENRVLAVLKEHPEARNDDMKLYLLVSKACIYDTHGISYFSFEESDEQLQGLRYPLL